MLTLDDISKSYDGIRAVDGLSLEVAPGSIYGLLGPNGAGKTTTIRMIMRIILPDGGRITLDGGDLDERKRDRVGYLPEERGLYRKMKVKEALAFLGEIKGMARRDALARGLAWLERFDLADRAEKKVEELSKGMQQKLQFVSTILHDPDLVILDEPFSGLDPINTELLKEIIQELSARGKTIIFSTHMMEQVELLCERICLIHRGRKVLDGKVTEIKKEYGRNTVRLKTEGDPGSLESLPGVQGVRRYESESHLELGRDADPQAILETLTARTRITHFEVMAPTVHEIFLDRVGRSKEEAAAAGGTHAG